MRILVLDDEKNIRRALTVALESMEHTVAAAPNSATAFAELRAKPYDAVLLDLKLAQESGLDVLQEILRIAPRIAVVMVTAYASVETAVEAMRRGAFDYLPKPCTPDQVREVLAKIEARRPPADATQALAPVEEAALYSEAPAMHKVLEVALKAAESDVTILLLGESGTGKSALARAIHQRSPRRDASFITVSCPNLSPELLESELFGHLKGAFTGATTETQGKIAAAEGGTLFLDEIGELPLAIQARLLRLLQEREYERVGETKSRRANVRVISATNRDLTAAVAAGEFREDLYYRLNVISVVMPPLRDRLKDIDTIARGALQTLAARAGEPVRGLSPEAVEALRSYSWPGNIRELRNELERALILSDSEILQPADFAGLRLQAPEVRLGGNLALEEVEAEHIRRVMANTRTLDEAAKVLGIDRATLYRKRKQG